MSDYPDPNQLPGRRYRAELRSYGPMWGWIAGALFVAVVVVIAISMARDASQTADDTVTRPPMTTGQSNRPLAAPPAANRPVNPPATTGQGSPSAPPSGSSQ